MNRDIVKRIWQVAVCALIKKNGRYLVVRRGPTDDILVNVWEFPSGKVNFNESVLRGLKREVKEETGIDIKGLKVKLIGISEYIIKKNRKIHCTIQLNYLVNLDKKEVRVKLSKEHSDFAWVNAKDSKLDNFLKKIIKQGS